MVLEAPRRSWERRLLENARAESWESLADQNKKTCIKKSGLVVVGRRLFRNSCRLLVMARSQSRHRCWHHRISAIFDRITNVLSRESLTANRRMRFSIFVAGLAC